MQQAVVLACAARQDTPDSGQNMPQVAREEQDVAMAGLQTEECQVGDRDSELADRNAEHAEVAGRARLVVAHDDGDGDVRHVSSLKKEQQTIKQHEEQHETNIMTQNLVDKVWINLLDGDPSPAASHACHCWLLS